MPARPSSAALHDALIMRSASGLWPSISRHHCTVSTSRSSSGHDRVHEPHRQRLLRVVLTAEEPDLTRLLLPDRPRQQPAAVPAVERTDARPGLAEDRVVGRDGEVAHDVQHVPAADRVARHHRDHRLRQAADLHLEVEHVEPADPVVTDVAVVAPDALVAAGAERERAFAGEHDDPDVAVVAAALEGVLELEEGLRPERVAHLRPADGDLGDAVRGLVADVAVAGSRRTCQSAPGLMTVSMGVSTLGAITPTNAATLAVDTSTPPCEGLHKVRRRPGAAHGSTERARSDGWTTPGRTPLERLRRDRRLRRAAPCGHRHRRRPRCSPRCARRASPGEAAAARSPPRRSGLCSRPSGPRTSW